MIVAVLDSEDSAEVVEEVLDSESSASSVLNVECVSESNEESIVVTEVVGGVDAYAEDAMLPSEISVVPSDLIVLSSEKTELFTEEIVMSSDVIVLPSEEIVLSLVDMELILEEVVLAFEDIVLSSVIIELEISSKVSSPVVVLVFVPVDEE